MRDTRDAFFEVLEIFGAGEEAGVLADLLGVCGAESDRVSESLCGTTIRSVLREYHHRRDCGNTPTEVWGFNHIVVEAQSPRLLYSVTLGVQRGLRNPNGVAAVLESKAIRRVGVGGPDTTPLGLRDSLAVFPRVAEYSNPGLEDGSPSGKMSKLQLCGAPSLSRPYLKLRVLTEASVWRVL
jgi:hypothetical protein